MDRKEKIFKLLLDASEKSFNRLFEERNEHFYYCSLVMMDCATPCITALSEEAYNQLLKDNADGDNSSEEDKAYFRWGYAESPYLGFGYEDYFNEVNEFFSEDVSYELPDDEYEERVHDWLIVMFDVMKTLKDKEIFKKDGIEKIFLAAEQQPSETDYNLKNAKFLNDDKIFKMWYKDNKDLYE